MALPRKRPKMSSSWAEQQDFGQDSNEKPLKVPQTLNDVPSQNTKRESNFYVLCGSLIKRYKSNNLKWHLHFKSRALGTINNREGAEFCVTVEQGVEVQTPVHLPINFGGSEVAGGRTSAKHGHNYPSVLIDVAEIVNHGENTFARILPAAIRLQSLDLCNRINGDPIQPVPSELLVKRFWRRTDGEHVLSGGSVLRSTNKSHTR